MYSCFTFKVTISKPINPLIEKTLVEVPKVNPKDKIDSIVKRLSKPQRQALIQTLTTEMKQASKALEFERAAEIRDMILELEGTLPTLTSNRKFRKS